MAAVLVLNAPDDGRLRPKHVEWLCRNKTCTVLHQVGVSFDLYYDARKHKIKIPQNHFQGKWLVRVSNRYDGPSTWRLEPLSRKWSPCRSLLFHTYIRHMASSAECWQTTLNVLACCLENGAVSFMLWRMAWDWGLQGVYSIPCKLLDKTSPLCSNYTCIRRKEKM